MQAALLLLALSAAITKPLQIEQGATWSASFDSTADFTAVGCDCSPLSDCLAMEIRTAAGGTLLAAPTLTEVSLGAGTFTASLTADQTGQLTFRSAVYDVELTCGAAVTRLFQGSVTLSLGVTTDEVSPGSFPAPGTPPGELYVPKAGDVTITGTKTFSTAGGKYLSLDATANESPVLYVLRFNPPPIAGWQIASYIGADGSWNSNAHLTITGNLDVNGIFQRPTTAPYMSGAYSDVDGPAIVARALRTDGSSTAFAAMARGANVADEHFLWRIDDLGRMWFGDSSTHNGLDTSIARTAALTLATNAHWLPSGDFAKDLGSTSARWRSAYFAWARDDGNNIRVSLDGNSQTTYKDGQGSPGASASAHDFDTAAAFPATATIARFLNNGSPTGAGVFGDGRVRVGQFVGTIVTLPTCDSAARGSTAYVDDTNDGAVSHLCFCGTAADDSTYGWRRADAPATACP